jgi:D-alanyl-D-alanine carboxypeptidase
MPRRYFDRAAIVPRLARSAALVLGLALLACAPAAAAPHAAMVIDANTGEVLHTREAEAQRYPASLTKMMTLYLVFELLEQKRITWDTRIRMTPHAASQPPSSLDLGVGATITVRDAVLALITKSANDVAAAIGESLSGSEERFARHMTAKARQIGMSATTFRNASGLPDSGQVTTARDMVTLAMRLVHDFPGPYKMFATRQFTYNGATYRNHNTLLNSFEGTDGIKTGYISSSGFNLVASVRRGKKHVIGVVMGGASAAQRNAQMRALLTQALGRAKALDKPLLQARPQLVARPARPPAAPPAAPVPRVSLATPAAAARPGEIGSTAERERSAADQQQSAAAGTPAPTVGAGMPNALPPPRPAGSERVADAMTPPPPLPPLPSPGVTETVIVRSLLASAAPPPTATPARIEVAKVLPSAAVAPAPVVRPAGVGLRNTGGPFQVQIGAYASEAEAMRRLVETAGRTGSLLAGHPPRALPVRKGETQLYRARYAGFEEPAAQAACRALKAQQVDCLVVRGE